MKTIAKTLSLASFSPLVAVSIALFLFCAGCSSVTYQPTSSSSGGRMTSSQAKYQLKTTLEKAYCDEKKVEITKDGFQVFYPFTWNDTPISWSNKSFSYRFREINNVSVVHFGGFGSLGGMYRINGINVWWRQLDSAQSFADALNVLVQKSKGMSQEADFEQFKQKAAAWRALATKPPLPEEAHKYQVLAANAVQEKRFEDAADYYEQGLEIEPCWPNAQHDVALIEGELGNYSDAAYHMRCYVELAPNASDAPAARDQAIIWDEKAQNPPMDN